MSIVFRCKCCGAGLEFEKNATVVQCEYCGVMQTLPKIDDDRRRNLYERANHFRQNGEFDKAIVIYEQVLNEDSTDAEAYWSLVLCRYGVEYVEDPATHRRVPTVNRTQPVPVVSDGDYKKALEYADSSQAGIYKSEAKQIDAIQKGILEISRREKPFDVFICYKESDANGQRTVDSVLAVDLYEKLTKEGFKVFYARVTLEDKLGQKYEPYIFAALNSAPVMIALGTRPEYFNAVWVRNEWSRFLMLMKNGAEKTLIPAYRDISPYDLPEEFVNLQAQDMSKVGFMQDLVRGIRKIIRSECPEAPKTETVIVNGGSSNAEALLKRAFIFLEDGDFANAESYCERVLDIAPESAAAYLGKLMIEKRVKHREDLAHCAEPFDDSNNYQKAVRYGNPAIVSELEGYVVGIKDRIEQARLNMIYNSAVMEMRISRYKEAIRNLKTIAGFKDSDTLIQECQQKIEQAQTEKERQQIEAAKEAKKKRIRLAVIVIVCAIVAPIAYRYYYASSLIEFSGDGNEQAVIKALGFGADVNAKNSYDRTALMEAKNAEVAKILLDAGADVNAKDKGGKTALSKAARWSHAEVVKILLDAGAEVNTLGMRSTLRTKKAETEPSKTTSNSREEVKKTSRSNGAETNAKSNATLIWAAGNGSAETVKIVLNAGADVNAKDFRGWTALMWAAMYDHAEVVKMLLDAGADVNARDNDGKTALNEAATHGRAGIMMILLNAGANVNAKDFRGWTALMNAALAGHTEAVKILLDAGADINAKINVGYVALMGAASEGHTEAVKILLDAGADINAKTNVGYTALIWAASEGGAEVVNLLLDAGADVNARDNDGKRAVDYARENEYLEGTDALKRLEQLSR